MTLSLIAPRPFDPAELWASALTTELGLVILTNPDDCAPFGKSLHKHRAEADDPRLYDFTVHEHIGGNEIWLIRKAEEVLE